jgi:hypothetical protein
MLLSGRGLYPMAMEIHYLEKYFQNIVEIKAARLRNQSTVGCEFIKLKPIFTGAAISMQDAARSSLAKSDKRSNVI